MSRTAAIIGGAVVIAAGLLAAAVVIAGNNSDSTPPRTVATSGGSGTANGGSAAERSTPDRAQEINLPPDAGPCAPGVWVRSRTTTCGFGVNVARAYRRSRGASSIGAYSPTTGIYYTMSCAGANPAVCTGGSEAAVYIATPTALSTTSSR
jgi:hypothetical protein